MTEPLISKLLEYGIAGVFIAVLMMFIFKLWKAKEARDEYIRKQSTQTSSIIGNMTNVIKTIMAKTNTLPKDVKKELQIDLEQIKSGIKNLEKDGP